MNKLESFIPLMTKEEYQLVEKYLNGDDILLEWGSGNSTIYFSELVKKVISIEHDIAYYNFVNNVIDAYNLNNIELIYVPQNNSQPDEQSYEDFKDYVEYANRNDLKFTKVLIDGRARIHCAFSILNMINENIIVMVHDFNAEKYHSILKYYKIIEKIDYTGPGIVALRKIKKQHNE